MKKLILLMLLAASPALAQAKMIASEPAANAGVKTPKLIKLRFSENLEPAFSGADLIDAAGRTVPVSKSVGVSTITLLPLSLKPGVYKVTWHSLGQHARRSTGSFRFTVIP